MTNEHSPTFLVDGVNAVAVHNGVARVHLMRLGHEGHPEPALELAVPIVQVRAIVEALLKVKT